MNRWVATLLVRCAMVGPLVAILLVPTGMCLCSEHEEDAASEQHEPGCPKVRKLDRPADVPQATPDTAPGDPLHIADESLTTVRSRSVFAVGHGPPRGRPLYISLQTFLI